jgi:hypothetical protein
VTGVGFDPDDIRQEVANLALEQFRDEVAEVRGEVGHLKQLLPRGEKVRAEFQRKENRVSVWLVLYWPDGEGKEYESLREDLRKAGWDDDGLRGLPPLDGENEITVSRKGSDLFNGQTKDEAKSFVAAARKVLRKHGIAAGRVRVRPWQDFL